MTEPGVGEIAPQVTHRNLAKKTHEMLVGMAEKDFVTGVPNFRALEKWLKNDDKKHAAQDNLIHDARHTDTSVRSHGVMIFLDVDGLGKANDISHTKGDELLIKITNACKAISQRADDMVFRRGERSDEFVVVLPGDKIEDYEVLEKKFNENISDASASLVFGTYGDNRTARETLSELDRTLSEAKANRPKGQHVDTIFIR